MNHPLIIQGGMGIGVSNWQLAREVSQNGQLGVISGTSLDSVLARRLQDGDPDGHMRRALEAFPFKDAAKRIMDKYFVPGGHKLVKKYKQIPLFRIENNNSLNELTVAANFVETFLAKEGHSGLVGINYLEKIQLPSLPSLYGALLAGIDYVIIGAGIPLEFPGVLRKLVDNCKATLKLSVENAAKGENFLSQFDPSELFGNKLPTLKLPKFMPIVSSNFLATLMARKASGPIDGLIIENHQAGGHNAPPRGKMELDASGEPIYGDRDLIDTEKIKELGLPFWLAGSYGAPERLQEALETGASGIQVGSAFALCRESGIFPDLKRKMIDAIRLGEKNIYTDVNASPTGFPFKVMRLRETISDGSLFEARKKVCNLGYLRNLYKKDDGSVGYRCPAESKQEFEKKGGQSSEATENKRCLCNSLLATIGLGTEYDDGTIERALITIGSKIDAVKELIKKTTEFSAKDVIDFILAGSKKDS